MNWHITNQNQLGEIADYVKQLIEKKENDETVVICLHGDLGAGKTTFTNILVQTLGGTAQVTSPTFVIMQPYDIRFKNYSRLIHMDWYRLEDNNEANILRLNEYLNDPKNIVIIEWGSNLPDLLPQKRIDLHFTWLNETDRNVVLELL